MSGSARHMLRLLFWESTAACNLSCAHCRRIDAGADGDMDTRQATAMLEQLGQLGKEQGFGSIIVFSGGEPLLRGDIFELATRARSFSLTPALATNGTLIDDGTANKLRSAGVARVAVSIDGAVAATHDGLRKQPGCFDRAMEGIASLRRAGIQFQLNFALTRGNAGELAAVYALAESLGAAALHVFILVPVGCGRELVETEVLTPGQYEGKLLEVARMAEGGSIQVKVTCGPQYERIIRQSGARPAVGGHSTKGCLAGTGVLFVSHTGTAFPCGYLPLDCGSVLKSTVGEIWRDSPQLAGLRDDSGLKGRCGVCEYKAVCGGCRARAFALAGDVLAEEPSCAYVPRGRGGAR